MNNALPKDWVEARLKDIASKITKGTTPTSIGFDFIKKGIKFIKIENIKNGEVKVETIKNCISEEAHQKMKRSQLLDGDVLYSIAGTIGRSCLVKNSMLPANTNQALAIIRGTKRILYPKYLLFNLQSQINRDYLDATSRGGGMNNISLKDVGDLKIYVAPLSEQKRIVSKLDAVLPRVEKLKESLNKTQGLLKQFRKSVLNAAVTGKLTEGWRERDWDSALLKDHTTKIGSGATPRGGSENYKDTGIPLIRSLNIHFEGFHEKGLAFIDEMQASKLDNVIVEENDVLLNITGASIGRVTTAPKNMTGARVNQHVCIIRPTESLLSKFLTIYLGSSIMQDFIIKENYGVTRQALTKSMIENFQIPLPVLEEQQEIVRRVDALFGLADKLGERLVTINEEVENLGKSVLTKAFRGELVPNEAELAEKEGRTYETAEELLVRIKAEKKKLEAKRKKKQ